MSNTLSPIIMVQWKKANYLKGNDPIRGTHFDFHDYWRKCKGFECGSSGLLRNVNRTPCQLPATSPPNKKPTVGSDEMTPPMGQAKGLFSGDGCEF